MSSLNFTFHTEIFRWGGDSAWHFIAVPADIADDIEDSATLRGGFGSIKVLVTIGNTTWNTSLFPDSKRKTFILPVKKEVRRAENLTEGDSPKIYLVIMN
jgi:hypothetical protein